MVRCVRSGSEGLDLPGPRAKPEMIAPPSTREPRDVTARKAQYHLRGGVSRLTTANTKVAISAVL